MSAECVYVDSEFVDDIYSGEANSYPDGIVYRYTMKPLTRKIHRYIIINYFHLNL